jgi:simple sugar transport system ATP-binding protein
VPADRIKVGSARGSVTVGENLIVDRRNEYSKHWVFDKKRMRSFSDSLIDRFNIDGEWNERMENLSGGNIQKVILAREIDQLRDYIVFSEPAWGLDIASSAFVYSEIRKLRDRGAAVILISTNLDEILAIADRVIVMYRGHIAAEISGLDTMPNIKEKIGDYMMGLKAGQGING